MSTSIKRLLDEDLPRRLRCFDSDEAWREFLLLVHDSGDRVVRRQDTGKHRGERKVIPVLVADARWLACDDCKPEYQAAMKAVGRCERVSDINAARKWLKALLRPGPMLAVDVLRVGREQGFHRSAIYRAAQRVGVLRKRVVPGDQATTEWSLGSRASISLGNGTFLRPSATPAPPTGDGDSQF